MQDTAYQFLSKSVKYCRSYDKKFWRFYASQCTCTWSHNLQLCRCKWSCAGVPDSKLRRSNLTAGHLQATLTKLLIYCLLRSTQPLTPRGVGNEYTYGLLGYGCLADWGGGMSASCTYCAPARAVNGRIVRCGIISSCQSAATSETSGHKSDWCTV